MALPSVVSAPSVAARPREKLIGSTTPRVFTPPLVEGPAGPCGCGCALDRSSSLGFEVEDFVADVLGIDLIPWERWLLIHMLELLDTGEFRFRTIILLVARQNGKSTILQILSLWMMYVYGVALVLGTAQNLDIAEEQWEAAVEMAEGVQELADEITQVSRVNGKKFLKLTSGERYKVAAASRKGGRGLSGDLVILDELREHQSWDAWGAITKTTMARAMALVVGASNAGDIASVVLRYLRRIAHMALGDPDRLADDDLVEPGPEVEEPEADESLGIFEWSAPPGCAIDDPDGWRQANPSLGYTITERAIRSASRTDPEWVFRTEVLCQWMQGAREGPFPEGAWEAGLDERSKIAGEHVWAVDTSWDRTRSHIAAVGWRGDGQPHAEIVESRAGTDWVVDWLTATDARKEVPVAVAAKRAPASSLVEPMTEAGLEVFEWDGVAGTAELYDRVRAAVGEGTEQGRLYHLHQPLLDIAAGNAATRPVGDAWAWDRRKSPVDIAPLVAITGGLRLLTIPVEDEPPPSVHEWPEDLIEEWNL